MKEREGEREKKREGRLAGKRGQREREVSGGLKRETRTGALRLCCLGWHVLFILKLMTAFQTVYR